MNQRNAKLFRPLFEDTRSLRKFKRAFTRAPADIQAKTLVMARRIKATGPVKHLEVNDGRD